jgi:hypothetical protein
MSAVLLGLLTNFLTLILGALAGMSVFMFRRGRILRFYGIRQAQSTIRIVISRLDVKPGGTIGTTTINSGYVGPAVTQLEYEAAVLLQEQIRPNISAWLSKEVRDWISGKLVVAAAVNPIIELAPAPADASSWLEAYARTNLILLGGPVYNAATSYYQEYESAHFTLVRGQSGAGWRVRSVRGGTPGDPGIIESRTVDRELALVQRIVHRETGTSITMCAGTSSGATLAGAEWLSRKYRQLDRRCRNGEFGILLAFVSVANPDSPFPGEISVVVLDEVFDGTRGVEGRARL